MNLIFASVLIGLNVLYNIIKDILLIFVPKSFKRLKDIQGQTVLITGAGSGVGRQLAIEFSKYSTCVVLLDIDKNSMLHTEKLMDRRSTVFLYECDVSNRKTVYEVAKRIEKDAGKVDILINNAGIVVGKNFMDSPDEMMEKTMQVNIMAHFWTCKAFLPGMMERDAGHLVFIASVVGWSGCPKLTHYCASKFAVMGFAESLLMELRKLNFFGIKVTTVCPSVISTGLFEGATVSLTKMLTPEGVAKEIVDAVLQEKIIVNIPSYLTIISMLKGLCPAPTMLKFAEDTGACKSMDNFVGRPSNNNSMNSQIQSIKTE